MSNHNVASNIKAQGEKVKEYTTEMDEYWNEAGGRKWVNNLLRIEKTLEPIGSKMLEVMREEANVKVLDVGCGGAELAAKTASLLGQGSEVIASDISQHILDEAKRNQSSANLRFLQCDVENYDFEPHLFDVVISRFGVMFFENPLKAFTNINRSMKNGGRLNLLVWKTFDENLWMKVPASAAFKILERPEPPKEGEPGPFSLCDSDAFGEMLSAAGFDDITFVSNKLNLNLGSLNEAVQLMTQLGPAAKPYGEAPSDLQKQARESMEAVLSQHESASGVLLPSAFWLVRATAL